MENNLNENVSVGSGKKITLPIKIIIIGCAIGLVVAGIGGIKQLNANKTNEERKQAATKASQEAVDEANARLKEIGTEYDSLKSQYDSKSNECAAIDNNTAAADWYEKTTKCTKEASEIKNKMTKLEMEDAAIKAKDYSAYYQDVKPMSYQIFYIIGASIAGLALLGAFIIYLVKGKKSY